jgi:hypothetical protein
MKFSTNVSSRMIKIEMKSTEASASVEIWCNFGQYGSAFWAPAEMQVFARETKSYSAVAELVAKAAAICETVNTIVSHVMSLTPEMVEEVERFLNAELGAIR